MLHEHGEMTGEGDEVVIQVGDITARLTADQVKLVCLIARGYTYRQIGLELGWSCGTIQNRVCDIKNRLGMNSRIEVVLALRDADLLT